MDLAAEIESELRRSPGQSASIVARSLTKRLRREISRREVNSALYASPTRFQSAGEAPPIWWVIGTRESNESRPPTRRSFSSGIDQKAPQDSQWSTLKTGRRTSHAPEPRRLYAWQAEALDAWRERGNRGVVEAVTGTGKTMLGVVAIEEQIGSGGKAAVIVPTIELQAQWHRILKRERSDLRIGLLGDGNRDTLVRNDVLIAVVHSASKADLHVPLSGGLVVADECHRYAAATFSKALDPRFERRLGLSATYARDDRKHRSVLDPYFGGACFEMGYPRAVGDDVTAHFKVALVGVRFSANESELYRAISERMGKLWATLVYQHHLPERDHVAFIAEVTRIAEEGGGPETVVARAYVKAMSDRRRLLAETPAKDAGLRKLSGAMRAANRTILFTQTIEGAERARDHVRSAGLTCECVSSDDAREVRARVLRRFERGDLDVLAAPRVLDEGVDVPEADLAVIVTASRTRRQMVQRMGRVLRRKHDGRLARFALIYVEGTTEDPNLGAHEDFLDDMDDCADEVRTFSVPDSAAEICDWLNAMVPAAMSTPRFEGDDPRSPVSRKHERASAGVARLVVSSGKKRGSSKPTTNTRRTQK